MIRKNLHVAVCNIVGVYRFHFLDCLFFSFWCDFYGKIMHHLIGEISAFRLKMWTLDVMFRKEALDIILFLFLIITCFIITSTV